MVWVLYVGPDRLFKRLEAAGSRQHVVYNSSAPENQAWVDSDYELPASLTRNKSKLRIEIRYRNATAGEINEFHYWIFSRIPAQSRL